MGNATGDHEPNDIDGDQGYVMLTFDDFPSTSPLPVAYPIMEEHDFEGVVGVITDRMNTEEEKDDLHTLWKSGWEVASHTESHEDLAAADTGELNEEVDESIDWITENGYKTGDVTVIYPYGSFDDEAKEAVRDEATFGLGGNEDPPTWDDPMAIGRVKGHDEDDLYDGLERASDEGEMVIPMYHGVTENGESELDNDVEKSEFKNAMDHIAGDDNLEVVLPTDYERLLDEGGD
jgi:peptidoglycan/xylan/chitin deacetylase (PgdA/CDA1 family)